MDLFFKITIPIIILELLIIFLIELKRTWDSEK